MCLIHIKVQSFIHMTVEFHVFAVIMQPQCPNERGKGAKQTLKNQSEKQAIVLLFKVQISLDHPSSNTN